MNSYAKHARHLCQRRRDIVAVAHEGNCATATIPPPLAQRESIGERLAGMLLVGQCVDDVQIPAGSSQCRRLFLRKGTNDEHTDPPFGVSRDVVKRLTRAPSQRSW